MRDPNVHAELPVPIYVGKDEMNLAEYPLSLLTHHIPRNQKTYSLTQYIIDQKGATIKQTWSIVGSDKYGLPTPYDEDVLLALLYCYKEQHLQEKRISFTLYQLCQVMQKTRSAREYNRIRESLNRLTSTTIIATHCFYDNLAKSWVSEAFHIFEHYKLYEDRKSRTSKSFIEMSEVFHRSVALANYIKDLDLGIYYSLARPLSKRLYRYLDKNRYKKSRYEEVLMKIARKLSLSDVYPSQVKQKLARAHEELLRKGYLTNVTYGLTQEREEKVIYEFAEHQPSLSGDSAIDPQAARQLVLDFYRQLTGQQSLAYDPTFKELALAKDYLITYGPTCAAFIIRHVLEAAKEVNFPIQKFGGTKNFLPQALAAWKKRTEVNQREEAAREQAELEACRQRTRERLKDVIQTLSPEELQALEQRAKAHLDLREGDLGYGLMVTMTRDELILHERLGFDIWPRIIEQLRGQVEEEVFNDILSPCQLEGILEDVLIISAPNTRVKESLRERYFGIIEELMSGQESPYRLRVLSRQESG